MSRTVYTPVISYTGGGNLATYTFSFKIEEKAQLLVVEYDTNGVETQRVRGTDITYLSSVTFDSTEGAGTVVLAANLATNFILKLLLANDSPTQPNQYRNKSSFTLKSFEYSLDWVLGPVIRASYLALRSIKIPDGILLTAFDPTLPKEITDAKSQTIVTNAAGTALEIGPTVVDISAAAANATAAAASAAAASTSETNAATSATNAATSATDAAASAASISPWEVFVTHAITAGQAATTLTDETAVGTTYSSVHYEYEIVRGTTIFANGRFAIQYVNTTWRLVTGPYEAQEAHGVTFTVSQSGTTGTIQAAVNAGSNGEIKLSRRRIAT